MSMRDLEIAFNKIENVPILVKACKGTIEYKVIDTAQKYLQLQFPSTYVKFLSKFGFLSLGGSEIYGIIDENFLESEIPDAIWFTQQNRIYNSLPSYMITIYSVGEGTVYCLDTSQMNEEGECPVVAWPIGGYETTPKLEVVAEDFGKFFLDMVERQIEYKKQGS